MSTNIHNLPELREQADRLRAEIPRLALAGEDTAPWRRELHKIEAAIEAAEGRVADAAQKAARTRASAVEARAVEVIRETLGRIQDALAGLQPPMPPTGGITVAA